MSEGDDYNVCSGETRRCLVRSVIIEKFSGNIMTYNLYFLVNCISIVYVNNDPSLFFFSKNNTNLPFSHKRFDSH